MIGGVGQLVEEAAHLPGAPAGPVGGDNLPAPISGQLNRPVLVSPAAWMSNRSGSVNTSGSRLAAPISVTTN